MYSQNGANHERKSWITRNCAHQPKNCGMHQQPKDWPIFPMFETWIMGVSMKALERQKLFKEWIIHLAPDTATIYLKIETHNVSSVKRLMTRDINSGVVISEGNMALRQGQRCTQQTCEKCGDELLPATSRAESKGKAYVRCWSSQTHSPGYIQ